MSVSGYFASPGGSESWPTPTSADGERRSETYCRGNLTLLGAALKQNRDLWPTPVASDDNKSPEAHMAMKARMKGGPRKKCTSLNVMTKMWPTPRAEDSECCGNHPGAVDSLTGATRLWPRLWPTPTADDARATGGMASRLGGRQMMLNLMARMWPTPSAQGSSGEISEDLVRKGSKLVNSKTGRVLQTNLATEVKMWATPTCHDGRRPGADVYSTQGGNLSRDATMWPTPMAMDHWMSNNPRTDGRQEQLPNAAARFAERWPTPNATDYKGASQPEGRRPDCDDDLPSRVQKWEASSGFQSPCSPLAPATSDGQKSSKVSKRLNPLFVTWMMGWPLGWATPSSSIVKTSYGSWETEFSLHLRRLLSSYFSTDFSEVEAAFSAVEKSEKPQKNPVADKGIQWE